MKLTPRLSVALLLAAAFAPRARADFDADLAAAGRAIEAAMPAAARRMAAGEVKAANAGLLAAVPEKGRTPAASFLLGNVLFEVDRDLSYQLHKAAALGAPDRPEAGWEWALEQHRAGEYAGALASYQAFSQTRPGSASPHALAADCLLRLGRLDEAKAEWLKSEAAPDGSIEQMENLVCAVHRDPVPYQKRADLLHKAVDQKDADAAADLIALDCDFPFDWWNGGPNEDFLNHDLPAVTAALGLAADDLRARSIAAAAACATADQESPAAVRAILDKQKLLIDPGHTLPVHGGLLSVVRRAGVDSGAVDAATLRDVLAPKLRAMALKGSDVELWNAAFASAAFASAGTGAATVDFARAGWKATADPRFAAVTLALKASADGLTPDDPELAAAVEQFPESGAVQRMRFNAAGKLTGPILAAAARAEFSHFTSSAGSVAGVDRPRSDFLRAYFKMLIELPPAM